MLSCWVIFSRDFASDAAPTNWAAVLVIDPVANTTDLTAMPAGTGCGGAVDCRWRRWTSLAYAPTTRKLYALPVREDAVLIIDPEANTTDVTVRQLWHSL